MNMGCCLPMFILRKKMSQVGLSFVCPIFDSPNVSHVGASFAYFAADCVKVSQHGILSAESDSRHTAKLAIMVTIRSVELQGRMQGCKVYKTLHPYILEPGSSQYQ